MHWQSLEAFLSMGGYGFYVWTSFGLTAVCMIVELRILTSRQQSLTQGRKV